METVTIALETMKVAAAKLGGLKGWSLLLGGAAVTLGMSNAREVEIQRLVAAGNSNKTVGDRLSISEETMKSHMKNVREKLAANDRTHAVSML